MIDKLKDEGFLEFLDKNSSGEYKKCSSCGCKYPVEMYSFRSRGVRRRGQCSMCHKNYSSSVWLNGMIADYNLSIGIKQCSKCKKELPVSNFSKDKHTRSGLSSNCRACISIRNRSEHKKLLTRKIRAGVTDLDIEHFKSIDNCEICGKPISGKIKCLDHNHATGKYRGALCTLCNQAIGMFNDNTQVLEKAIVYISERGW